MMRRLPRLVSPGPNQETIETLLKLLEDAQAGRIVGIAYVALHNLHGYSADIVGAASDSPLLARGICRALEDAVAKKL